jgi:tetratricopeptide (TPR) repeat protein
MKHTVGVPVFRLILILALTIAACLTFAQKQPPVSNPATPAASQPRKASGVGPSASLQSLRNIGKAYYEQGKYVEAIGEFQKVVASGKALPTDHLDLGMALMLANKLDAALGELTTARQMDSHLVAADYNLGILYKRELRYPDAEAALKRVIAVDAEEPAVWFNLGSVYFFERKLDECLDAHRHVLDLGFGRGRNFYIASLFRTFTVLVRLKRSDEAQKVLKQWESMHEKVPNISLQDPALEGGKYGAILVPASPPAEAARPALAKVTFREITARLGINLPAAATPPADQGSGGFLSAFHPSVTVADYDGDGHPDLYVVDPHGSNHLFHNNGDGTFSDVTAHAGVEGPGGSVSATFADYDNSGHPSLFVAGAHGVTVYQNRGDGTFEDATEKCGLKMPPGLLATQVLLFDADNDGFLDLVVTLYGDLSTLPATAQKGDFPRGLKGLPSRFYRNHGDGTFADITSSTGLESAEGRMRGAVFADFNNDGYTDLLFLRDDGPPLLYLNQGEDKFVNRTAEAGEALARSRALEAQVADFDHDGNLDLALWSDAGYQVLLNRGNARFTAVAGLPPMAPPGGAFDFKGTVVDVDGDGFADLVNLDAGGRLHWLRNRAGRFQESPLGIAAPANGALAYIAATSLDSPGKLDLVGVTQSGQLIALEKAGPPARWVDIKMNGFKSNSQGIGSVVEFKAGNYYNKVEVTGSPLRIFTGDLTKLDVIRVTWPNAVVQNWIDAETDKQIEVRESERLASSCPFLYAWDGRKFVYVTDVLGVAPIGELAPDGSRLKPFPEEFVRLPKLVPDPQGDYVFQLTDEMREAEYFDQVKLVAVDHPSGEEIYPNEMYTSHPGPPRLFAVRDRHLPLSAVDDHGHDVLPLLREADGRYPTDFARHRILGLAELHSLTLDLGELPANGPVSLWLTGWVFWTDSNGARALESNRQLEMVAPYLQVRDSRGTWVTVVPDMGLPSGTNRTMCVDLRGKFLSPDHHVRIVTNLCVYWDQIFFTTNEGLAPAFTELPLTAADLHYRGFSAVTSDPEHLKPDSFNYAQVMATAPWNPLQGRYTRYGSVRKLLARPDDELVVMATGDEMTVKFSGRALAPVKPGWKRDFFLYLRGWAKDGEPNTAFSSTVAPLPFGGMSDYPPGPQDHAPDSPEYQQYRREYLTRPGYALIPPLAPAVQWVGSSR